MKTLKLDLDLKDMKLSDEEKKMGPVGMSLRIINNVISTYGDSQGPNKHYRGLNKHDRKSLYTLMSLFKAAEKEKLAGIELDDKEIKFLQRCFTVEFMPNEVVALVEANIEALGENK